MSDDPLLERRIAFERRYKDNYRIEGTGVTMRYHFPCPFCGASDWLAAGLLTLVQDMAAESTCAECGRAARVVSDRPASGGLVFELVQTAGPDAPAWLPIRRDP